MIQIVCNPLFNTWCKNVVQNLKNKIKNLNLTLIFILFFYLLSTNLLNRTKLNYYTNSNRYNNVNKCLSINRQKQPKTYNTFFLRTNTNQSNKKM